MVYCYIYHESHRLAIVKAFKLDGYELIFHLEDHDPEHFHLSKKGEPWEVRIHFMLCTETHLETTPKRPSFWAKNYCPLKRAQAKELRASIVKHRAALLLEWESYSP